MRYLTKRLADRPIAVELSDTALDLLAESGFDSAYVARPLRRTLQRLVLDQLAKKVLKGELPEGGSIRVDKADGNLSFEMSLPATV